MTRPTRPTSDYDCDLPGATEPVLPEESFDFTKPPRTAAKEAQTVRMHSQRWGAAHKERAEAALQGLLTDAPEATAAEKSLLRLAAATACVVEKLDDVQAQLAVRLELLVDNPGTLLTVARALREVTRVHMSNAKTTTELLQAAGTLRSQRRLMDRHERTTWHGHNDGARRASTGTDRARPAAAAN
jgi:hypothetical protein